MSYDALVGQAMTFGDGGENPSGIGEQGFLIPVSWIKTMAKPVPSTTPGSLVTITSDYVMKTGKAPIPITALFDKSGITWSLQGEVLSKIFQQGLEAFVPSNSVDNLGTLQSLKNYRYIALFPKLDDSGHYFQVGSDKIAANITDAPGGTGVGPTGEVGSKITLQSYGLAPVLIYQGEIPPVGPA
ncbi:hypothetical protein D3C87_664320 [compost metagenome]